MEYITLRIKKQYYDEIHIGTKRIEYRKNIGFYKKQLDKNPKIICFHYQSKERLIAEIDEIELIPNIFKTDRPEFLNTDEIYAIHFSNVYLAKPTS